MDLNYLNIELSNELVLKFQLLDTPITKLWVERMALRDQYPLDHPDRFYGFNEQSEEETIADDYIKKCINTINSYQHVIDRPFTNIYDQDNLNYLHNIFERYHGLLDHQDQEFFVNAPDKVKQALAELNLAVHRCETVIRGPIRPRFVCTWYGLPKTKSLTDDLIGQYGTLNPEFGVVCLNYCEIGKTLEDLTNDRDNYISDDAFRPFNYYSADFVVRLHEETLAYSADKIQRMQQYYLEHLNFFHDRGYTTFQHPRLLPYRIPVAKLVETMSREQLLKEIQHRQQVTKVYLE
jgi:hypothetical protein